MTYAVLGVSMDSHTLAAWVGVVLAAAGALGSAVWAVATINASLRGLGRSIDSLRGAVGRLDSNVAALNDRLDEHNTRISRLEGRHEK